MSLDQALTLYVDNLRREYATGIAREHAYRPALKSLLEAVENGIIAVNDPKHIEAGAPDYVVQRQGIPLGAVEAKDITVDLDRLGKDDKKQLDRYLGALPNLIYTNYLHFRWYVNGELKEDVRIGELRDGKIEIGREGLDNVAGMLHRFINMVAPTVDSPRELASRMAKMTREITILIENSLADSETLKAQMAAFQQTLIPDLNPKDFADMYAQTLAYGLFAARVGFQRRPEEFTLRNAFWDLPKTNPFLKQFFQQIAPQLDERVRYQVEILANLLAHADMDEILRDFGRRTRTEDPVVHFYETFLREYNPQLREQRGVYYTPEPVVSYIVRSVDYLLRERFGRELGLADTNTLVLDPATGTGTFLYFVIQHIHDTLRQMNQLGMWNKYVSDHLLPRLFGFELLMAPYAVAHMKLGIQLKDLNYDMEGDQRLGVYLTNTLEEAVQESEALLAGFISNEANAAAKIKRKAPIMVVLGNPPYSGHSANRGEWIREKVRDYYFVDGKPLGERNPKWLQDDYVKFIRFGQWRINETQSGVLAYVSNNGYLDNPTFRGMRQQLMNTFSDIYILNLHGNHRKREKTPDGGADENVFDIQQGVAIGIFVKEEGNAAPARVHYADLWGVREDKYKTLRNSALNNTAWKEVHPQAPLYLFIPQDVELREEYEHGWRITDVMPVNVLGFQSHRDNFAIDFDQEQMRLRVQEMRDTELSDEQYRQKYALRDNRDWQLSTARNRLRQNPLWERDLIDCLYRPFDKRFCYFSEVTMDYPRRELIQHVAGKQNSCLNTVRQTKMAVWQHALVSDSPTPAVYVELKDGSSVFPLYLYPDPNQQQMFAQSEWTPGKDGRTPNLNPKFVQEMEAKLGMQFITDGRGDLETTFGPEDVFHYAYAVFHCPTYRARYAEFLKIDFPRLPLTSDKALFRALCEYGAQLVDLHLMRGAAIKLITGFHGDGDNLVANGYPKYTEPTAETAGRVHINQKQYFEGITPELWDFHIGGYQVLEKWLKDRRGRNLSVEDVMHYQRIVVALAETDRIMDEIDETIPPFPLP